MRGLLGAIVAVWLSAVGASAQAQLSIAMDHLKVAELIQVFPLTKKESLPLKQVKG